MDYQGNSNKDKEPKPSKNIERVVKSEVLIQKPSLGQKIKSLFIKEDLGSVMHYVIYEVIVPATVNLFVDASSKGIERMAYGERAGTRRGYNYGPGQRMTYNNPINRSITPSSLRPPPAARQQTQMRTPRENLIFSSREEANLVLERMNDIIDSYESVSVADLNDLVGITPSHVDNKWGWIYLGDVQIRQVREGFILDLPLAEPFQ